MMKQVLWGLLSVVLVLMSAFLYSAPELLLKSEQSWNGGSFSYLSGEPEITSVKLVLQEGKDASYHCHPVPTMGFISKGKVQLETPEGKKNEYEAGESVIEVMKGLHRGKALSKEAEIIVFYAGVKGVPNTVFPDDIENFKKYCQ